MGRGGGGTLKYWLWSQGPSWGDGPGFGLTCSLAPVQPHGSFLQCRGLRLEVEELDQDGRVVPSGAQVGQSQCPATAPASAIAGAQRDARLGCAIAHGPSPGLGGERPGGWQEGVEAESRPGEETGKWGGG